MSMRICLSHLQLWQIPRPKIHLRKSRSSPGFANSILQSPDSTSIPSLLIIIQLQAYTRLHQ